MWDRHFDIMLIDRLPPVHGRLIENARLAGQTWLRVGGEAEILFKPADRQDLIDFVTNCPADIPITVLGVASNLLIRDGGIPGVTIMPKAALSAYSIEPELVEVEAGVLDATLAQAAAEQDLAGLEFLSGIPGTIGGAIVMNAGCYGQEIADVLISATILLRSGRIVTLSKDELTLTYRHCGLPKDAIVLDAALHVRPGEPAAIAARMAEIKAAREEAQPTRARTGGSTFANPDGYKAWQLIEQAGCRGLTIGGAQMSEKHCNFLINTGDATAADLEALGEEVRARVMIKSGIDLHWEIKRIGVAA